MKTDEKGIEQELNTINKVEHGPGRVTTNIRSCTVWEGQQPYVRKFNICKADDVFSKDNRSSRFPKGTPSGS